MKMTFGKYKSKEIDTIPTSYLHWVVSNVQHLNTDIRREIHEVLSDRNEDIQDGPYYAPPPGRGNDPRQYIAEIADRWYRLLALAYHPDRGGNVEMMQKINDDMDRIKDILNN
jgi:phosphatidylethanolamine-binding protein (PEBP) family uncharacterized protein